ncbi:hypothetical protein PENTCL1PPCAC_1269, partial [Pristionchus entomophagus]
ITFHPSPLSIYFLALTRNGTNFSAFSAMNESYRQWIANYQYKPGFVNNYFSAVLFLNMNDNHKLDQEFPIPLSLLEEELGREDLNVSLQADRATISISIKYLIIHLLRKVRTEKRVTVSNYEDILRSTLNLGGILPEGVTNPLTLSTSFHCLPSVCKIYIIDTLRRVAKLPSSNVSEIGIDTERNMFYVLPDGRVYVYVKVGNDIPTTDVWFQNQTWFPLYQHTLRFKFNLMSETDEQWALVERDLRIYGQQGIIISVNSILAASLKQRKKALSDAWLAREMFFLFISPTVASETPEPPLRQSLASPTDATRDALAEMSVADWNTKCPYFPQCRKKNRCEAIHPTDDCNNFFEHRSCPGLACLFLHGPCPIDGDCDDENCIHEHYKSPPVVLRTKRQSRAGPNKKNIRCQHFPNCRTSAEKCGFVHPVKECRKFIESVCVQGRLCVYLHGDCPEDGYCEDDECPHEHYKSPPVAQRQREPRQRYNRSMSRRRSMSRAAYERSRRDSSPDYDSRNRSYLSNSAEYSDEDESPVTKPLEQRCRFFPGCENKKCAYIHPKENCKAFPNCPYGGACLYVHKTCPKDGVCVKLNCNHEHYVRRSIGKLWCRNGSVCKKQRCDFLHPKECKAPCSSPGTCWMYHPPGVAAAATGVAPAASAAPAAGRSKSRNRRSPSARRNRSRNQKNERR